MLSREEELHYVQIGIFNRALIAHQFVLIHLRSLSLSSSNYILSISFNNVAHAKESKRSIYVCTSVKAHSYFLRSRKRTSLVAFLRDLGKGR